MLKIFNSLKFLITFRNSTKNISVNCLKFTNGQYSLSYSLLNLSNSCGFIYELDTFTKRESLVLRCYQVKQYGGESILLYKEAANMIYSFVPLTREKKKNLTMTTISI